MKNRLSNSSVVGCVSVAFLILLESTTSGDAPSVRERYQFHISNGDEQYRNFDNAQALVEFKQAYHLAPDSFPILQRMVMIFNDMGRLKLGKDDTAESYYRSSLAYADSLVRYFPERPESHFWLALDHGSLIPFLGVKEKMLEARVTLREARRSIEIDSTFALGYVVLGIFQREGSKISWFERVIARVVFGEDISGSLKESESLLRKSVQCDPRNSFARYELHWTYRAMGDSAKAIECLMRVLEIPPRSAREQQQFDEARKELSTLTKKS